MKRMRTKMERERANTVPPEGPLDAEIVFVGEAPAAQEIAQGRPFAGSAGHFLDLILANIRMERASIYITNVSKERAPGDKMERMPKDRVRYWGKDLIQELNDLPNVRIIVPLGNYALHAVTGRTGITNLRGSVLEPISEIRHNCLVVPTIHPSTMHYQYEVWPLIAADLERVKGLANRGYSFKPPEFEFILDPTFDQVMMYLTMFEKNPDRMMTVDVETPHGLLSCIGLGWSRKNAICIPFFLGNGDNCWSEDEEILLWKRLADVLPKLNLHNQNFFFDWMELSKYGILLKIPKWDPMLMHHCLYSSLPHKLDTITSLYTEMTFYKKDDRDPEAGVKGSSIYVGRELEHWRYNCFDCCAAYWSIEELAKELEEEGMMDIYQSLYVGLFEPLLDMNKRGVKIDIDALIKHREILTAETKLLNEELEIAAGHPINAQSPKQVAIFLYDELNFTPYKERSGTSRTTKEEVLKKLAYKYQIDLPLKIVQVRKNEKELSLFDVENIVDGYMTCQYSLGRASTGRLASRKAGTAKKIGMNLQNVKRGRTRRFFIPEDGHRMVQADQMQAEARMVAWYSEDPKMKVIAESGLIHMKNAENLFGKAVEKDGDQYQIAKALVHAGNYDIGIHEFARTANIPYREAKTYLESYHRLYPGIRQVYHKYVQREIEESRMLYNPFGRRLVFFGRMDRETFKLGYAFLPQSTVSDINKQAVKKLYKHFIILLESHDGVVLSVPIEQTEEAIEALNDAYNISFEIREESHRIPIEISVGPNWAEMEKVS